MMNNKWLRVISMTALSVCFVLSTQKVLAAKHLEHAAAQSQEQSQKASEDQLRNKKDEQNSVNINTADAATLTDLKGIGPKKAQNIIAYRNEHGAFKSVDDLAQVKGIGEKSLARLVKNNPGRIVVN